jgi:tRNA threonylcarbamoyladenosine biosynthesis protein TsaE
MEKIKTIHSLAEMQTFAHLCGKYLKVGFVIGLEGDLGAGKTTFTKFLGESIGIKGVINSPTFTIMKVYEEGRLPLYHIDAYRLDGIGSDYDLEEYIDGNGVTVIEWYSRILKSMPEVYLALKIEWTGEESRKIIMKGRGAYESIVEALSA